MKNLILYRNPLTYFCKIYHIFSTKIAMTCQYEYMIPIPKYFICRKSNLELIENFPPLR